MADLIVTLQGIGNTTLTTPALRHFYYDGRVVDAIAADNGSSRVLVITGQAETAFYGKGLAYVHEAENQVPMLASVCRRVESPRHASQLVGAAA